MASAPRSWVESDVVVVVSASEMKPGWSAEVLGVVSCLDYASGALRWERRFDARQSTSSFATTLLVEGDQVFLALPNHVLAYALADGTSQWVRSLDGDASQDGAAALAVPGLAVQGDRDTRS